MTYINIQYFIYIFLLFSLFIIINKITDKSHGGGGLNLNSIIII
jgi:hypothetical protein